MGNRKSKRKALTERNRRIEERIIEDKKKEDKIIKILVLGTGESGKSTFIKQLNILFKGGFSRRDRKQYSDAIRANLIMHMQMLCNAVSELGLHLDQKALLRTEHIMEIETPSAEDLTKSVAADIKKLWSLDPFKEAFQERSLFQIPDSAGYYFDNIDRIVDDDYEANDEDILGCRIPTTGVNVVSVEVEGRPWNVVDVGGQRSERKKWIHQFSNVTIVIYVVALSEFNQKLFEDRKVNRMHESLEIFASTANNEFFREKNVIVLLNKVDLLREKLEKGARLQECFPSYTGDNSYESVTEFIRKKFLEAGENNKRSIFFHYSCATDTENMRGIIDSVSTTIIEHELQ